jgi:hypothetical protein
MRFTWAGLSREEAGLSLEWADLAVAVRGPVLVDDAPAKAMVMVAGFWRLFWWQCD